MKRPNPAFGVLVTLISCVLFAVMGAMIRHASTLGIDSFKTSLFRFAIGLAVLGTLAMSRRITLRFFDSPLLFLRGLTGGTAIFLFYLSIDKIGIAKGTVISYSYNVFAVLGSMILLKERVGPLKWLLIFASLAGIGMIAADKAGGAALTISSFEWLAILGAVLSGIAIVIIKKLCDTDSPFSIFFAQSLVGFWLMVIPANLTPVELQWTGGVLLLLIGLTAAGGQLCMTTGYAHLTVATAGILGMLVPVFNTAIGVVIFREHLSALGLAGVAVVIATCAMLAMPRFNRRRPDDPIAA